MAGAESATYRKTRKPLAALAFQPAASTPDEASMGAARLARGWAVPPFNGGEGKCA